MKKNLILFFFSLTILTFIACGSTANIEPETNKTASVPEEKAEEKTDEPVAATQDFEDFSKENEALLTEAEAARQKAIDAGAEKYFPKILAKDDAFFDSVKSKVHDSPNSDHTEDLREVISRYNALATACMAKNLKEKADELGLSDPNAEKALSDFEISEKGSDMNKNADKALKAYSALLMQHMSEMAKTERNAALEAKKQADSVKAGVAKKDEYKKASDTFKQADSNFVSKNLENAYKGYHSAKITFANLYETIAAKRAAAQAAIERAKKRVSETENYTAEADTIAPLNEEVAGIEKEDAVLLESDNFANPDDAVIDVESSEDAKNAAAIDESINMTEKADANAEKGETK